MKQFCLASLACLVCLAPARAQTPEIQAKVQSVLYVKRLQTLGGGFLSEMPDPKSNKLNKANLRATSSAIRALKYLGSEVPNLEVCKKFVASCFDKNSGGFADMPGGKVDVFTTAVGIMAVAELGMPAEPYHAGAVKYLKDNVKTFDDVRIAVAGLERIKEPPPRKTEWLAETMKLTIPPVAEQPNARARMVASQVVSLLRLGETPKDTASIIKDLQAGQRGNGGFGKDESPKGDLESTYRVMRAFVMLKARPANAESLRNFVHKCRNEDGGYAVSPGQPSSVSGTYFAAIIMHWLDEKK
jgi:hypothetical protein